MKRINEYIKNNLLGVMVILGLFCIQLLSIIFVISDKYDDTLMELNKKIEVLEKKKKLSDEITDLINLRGTDKDDEKLNKLIEEKKKLYIFYNQMLKNM